jgi:hypothetical protein
MSIEDLDNRMFQLYEELKSRGVLKTKRAFCHIMGLPEQNMSNIKNGVNHFNLIHVANICRYYNLNANWVIDRNETELFKTKKLKSTQTVHKSTEKVVVGNANNPNKH